MVQGLNPELEQVLSKATRATIGIDLTEPDVDTRDWEEMLQGGLQTALESQVIVFEVSGVSRASTHQIVRSRKAAFHQQSMRASFYGAQPDFRMPESIWRLSDAVKNQWVRALEETHKAYRMACDEDASYQDARYILAKGTVNYILCEYSLREFMAVYNYRGCSMFQWEIVSVMRAMRTILVARYPWLDPYVKISLARRRRALWTCRGLTVRARHTLIIARSKVGSRSRASVRSLGRASLTAPSAPSLGQSAIRNTAGGGRPSSGWRMKSTG
jgi:thymidylate synthase ThyX